MLRTSYHLAPHLSPINTPIQFFIHKPTDNNIIASHKIQPRVWLLSALLLIVLRSDNALDGVFQDEIRDLVAADEGTGECAAVDCENEDLFCFMNAGGLALLNVCKRGWSSLGDLVRLTVEIGCQRHLA